MLRGRPKLISIAFPNTGVRRALLRLFFPRFPPSAPIRYAFAVACCVVAFVLRLWLDPLLHENAVLLLFTLAVAASAIRGGFGPGLLATFLGAFGVIYFVPPKFFFTIAPGHLSDVALQLTAFTIVGVILSWLSGELRRLRWEATETLAERDAALERVQLLSGLLPICAGCKKIRDEEGNWQQIELYISKHSEAEFSHGMCPACGKQYYGELWPETSKSVR